MKRLTAVLAVALAISCAGQKPAQNQTEIQQQRIENISYFDLANCNPRTLDIAFPANQESLVGVLIAANPEILECLVDPRSRGNSKDTKVSIDLTIGGQSETRVTGENLTPQGEVCIKDALLRLIGSGALSSTDRSAPSKATASAHRELQHVAGLSPSVIWGRNEASDDVGKIRLAERSWCDCFSAWQTRAPRALKAHIKLADGKATPAQVSFEPTNDPTADAVASCLKGKLEALPLSTQAKELNFSYPFLFVHSGVSEVPSDAAPDLKFLQLESMRGQRSADTAMKLGMRTNAWHTYDLLVARYKAKKDASLVKPLKDSCAKLLKADDGWAAALERQLQVEDQTAALISQLKAQDQAWADAERASQRQVQTTQGDLQNARKARSEDAAACPKEKYE